VVLKPDPRTAVCGVVFARVFEEAGLPPGLFHVLPGGADVGAAVVDDPLIRVIAFTGSTRAGKIIAEQAAKRLQRVHLELGGNSALIVLDDVDLEKAVSVGAFGSSGLSTTATRATALGTSFAGRAGFPQDEAQVVGQVGEEGDLGGAGVGEDPRHPEPAEDVEGGVPDRRHGGPSRLSAGR
jgi:benzaldehyde dehydrogenase (NAD)